MWREGPLRSLVTGMEVEKNNLEIFFVGAGGYDGRGVGLL